MVNNIIRTGFGVAGSVIALCMYAVPAVTFKRVIKKRTTEDFSGIPYLIALFNCLLYTYYGSPLISNGWDNLVVMIVNAVGLLLEFCFISIYLIFAPPKTKRTMVRMLIGVLTVAGTIAAVSLFALHDQQQKKFLVGTVGMVATVILYGSPLSVIRLVIKTKSVEFMPFNLSFFAFLSSTLWLAYGTLSKDIVIMAPNFIGLPLSLFQMILYCIYRHKKSVRIEDGKLDAVEVDLEKNKATEEACCCTEKTKPDQETEMQLKV
ncbi:hypothetical protein SUGI_0748250 [Cryptomeria japonica]|uniref:bidirectional sugar transporter SWEET3b n=1 Tax=Cryptomeria japonica TaxID=3369 RepID=UPI0024147381|nr:bidirectional sugar transporter SWEET3b [Cryptomeria japonica]GLJ36974.1 hypothetical protein SUGI_0748250 [Cryptomeria japonica]